MKTEVAEREKHETLTEEAEEEAENQYFLYFDDLNRERGLNYLLYLLKR